LCELLGGRELSKRREKRKTRKGSEKEKEKKWKKLPNLKISTEKNER
jgi:hypothetical protein